MADVCFKEGTQSQYNSITPDNYTFYYCTDTNRCFLGSNELTNDEDIQAVMAALSIVETKANNAQETADEAVTAASNAQSTADAAIKSVSASSPLSASTNAGAVTLTHSTSGATAGTYGPTANSSPSAGGTFSVPSVTVDTYGHVTSASSRTITLPSVEGYQYATYTLPATAGWYRIASSPVSVTNNAGLFTIRGQVNGRHTTATMEAGISYNTAASASCNFLNVHSYGSNWLFSKVRIVYNTSYSGNYAYLEIYQSSAYAGVYRILASNCVGWTLNTGVVEGEIPDGYTSKEFSLDTNGALIADTIVGSLTGNATTATTATNLGTATVGSGTKPIYLSSGAPTASSSTVGSSSQPVYLSSGTITACTDLSTTPEWENIK